MGLCTWVWTWTCIWAILRGSCEFNAGWSSHAASSGPWPRSPADHATGGQEAARLSSESRRRD
eukprot:5648210-Pyramimonas_sp.AAC.1